MVPGIRGMRCGQRRLDRGRAEASGPLVGYWLEAAAKAPIAQLSHCQMARLRDTDVLLEERVRVPLGLRFKLVGLRGL